MELIEVKSSNIARVGYDQASATLGVQFLGGNVYHYLDVPPSVHDELMATESKGKYFAANIKPKFKCQKVDGQPAAPSPAKAKGPELVKSAPVETSTPALPSPALALSFTAGNAAVARPFEEMVEQLKSQADEFCTVILAEIGDLVEIALGIQVTDEATFTQAAEIGKQLADKRKSIDGANGIFKPTKKAVDAIKAVFLDKEAELRDAIARGEDYLKNARTKYAQAEQKRAQEAAEAERKRLLKEAEDKRIAQAEQAEAAGKPNLANALLSTPVTAPKVEVQAAVPKVAGTRHLTFYKFRVLDPAAVPREWLMVDESKIGQYARDNKLPKGTILNGVEFYTEEAY